MPKSKKKDVKYPAIHLKISRIIQLTIFLPYLYEGKPILSALNAIRRFIETVPKWAFVVVLIVVAFHSANLYQLSVRPLSGETENPYDGHYIIDHIMAGGLVDKAGIKLGDTIVSCNGYPLEEWYVGDHGQKAGDTLRFGMVYNNRLVEVPVVITSSLSMYPVFYFTVFIIFILVSAGSLFILYKKPHDKPVTLFFLIIQQFSALSVGAYLLAADPLSIFILMTFLISGAFIGPTLIHFHLIYPKPVSIMARFRRLPAVFYIAGAIILMPNLYSHFDYLFFSPDEPVPFPFERIGMLFLSLTFILAISIAIYQFIITNDTLTRNQLRIVVLGSFFGLITDILFFIFYNRVYELWSRYPNLVQICQGTGSLILIACLLIAIFRYRIWNIEIVLRKALLYLGATIIIILSYLLFLYLVDYLTLTETKFTRFIILALSVIIFLVVRDRLQKLIDRIFHREMYDSATVVSTFEEKLSGVYRIEELGSKIVLGLDEIFHFKLFILNLRKEGLIYEPAFVLGSDRQEINPEFSINQEFEHRLKKSHAFSPGELEQKPEILEIIDTELVIPLIDGNQPYGFFICGQKQSEKTYSMQDIRVLSLIARRVIALFQTASLYRKDLDRQLMLERERARIVQDMHDDIGAGLTKIAMMSEAGKREKGKVNSEKVAATAREMITRLNVIVWALNPRYDNLESLISYARRYFGEYLENFGIALRMEEPDDIPEWPVTPDFRRNAFYAWQEAIHNAVKHGKCSEIKFEIRIDGRKLFVTITDNGKGFDNTLRGSGGNGLLNMKKRAEEMGGTFAIESEPGKGTSVRWGLMSRRSAACPKDEGHRAGQ
ncbi:MAG: ATP-binding protein [Bacteroidales bacterium]|jgi:signal transduction histidine kinase|nr:ATP-binding protein [Bacteroidales bacterium]